MRNVGWMFLVVLAGCPGRETADKDAGTAATADAGTWDASVSDAARPDAARGDAAAPLDAALPQDAATPADAAVPMLTGHAWGGPGAAPGALAGITWNSGGDQGVTSADGTFRYAAGGTVHFSVGHIQLATVPGAPILTPLQLAGSASCAVTDAARRLVVLLESLDADQDPATGIALPGFTALPASVNLVDLSDPALLQAMQALVPGTVAADGPAALHRMISQVDVDVWEETGMSEFTGTDAIQRTQGVTGDGTSTWFSFNTGLSRTNLQFQRQVGNMLAIPWELGLQGIDHIGDIDVFGNTLYAPMEDSRAYAHPTVVLFSADQLDATGEQFTVDTGRMANGVPWVAVDGPAGKAYMAQWSPTPVLYRHNLADFAYEAAIPLSVDLQRIQGAKVRGGMMYANVDGTPKTVFKINLETGTVIPLFSRDTTVEQEGIALFDDGQGNTMHTLNVGPQTTSTELHHYRQVEASLRQRACP